LTSTVGHGAAAAHCWLTEPSSNPASGDRPRVPSTRMSAPFAAVISASAVSPSATTGNNGTAGFGAIALTFSIRNSLAAFSSASRS
jgi:hypothetical protein